MAQTTTTIIPIVRNSKTKVMSQPQSFIDDDLARSSSLTVKISHQSLWLLYLVYRDPQLQICPCHVNARKRGPQWGSSPAVLKCLLWQGSGVSKQHSNYPLSGYLLSLSLGIFLLNQKDLKKIIHNNLFILHDPQEIWGSGFKQLSY